MLICIGGYGEGHEILSRRLMYITMHVEHPGVQVREMMRIPGHQDKAQAS